MNFYQCYRLKQYIYKVVLIFSYYMVLGRLICEIYLLNILYTYRVISIIFLLFGRGVRSRSGGRS